MKQPELPSSWEDLSWDELVHVHQLIAENKESKAVRNLKIYLYLTHLHIVSGDGASNPDGVFTYYLAERNEKDVLSVRSDDLTLYLCGCHLEMNDDSQRGYSEKVEQAEQAGVLDWIDQPIGKEGKGGLTKLPKESIIIGGRRFCLPSALITNLTYEQYQNVQKLQQAIWQLMEYLSSLHEQPANQLSQIVDELNTFRSQLLCHLLVPYRWRWADQPWMDNIRHHGIALWKWKWNYSIEYKSQEAEALLPWMKRQRLPPYLFDILIQHLQNCLSIYKRQFPELFSSGASQGQEVIPLISEVDTVNAIMKWQQYPGQQQVYDSNAIQVFGILNSMTKEAKAIEEASAKMKRQQHK